METSTPRQSSRPVGPVLLCLILCSLVVSPLQAQEVAAKVQFAVGDVSATAANGQTRRLKKGDRIYTGDTVKTGDSGSAQLIYRDRSRMAVRVNTEFKVKEYKYDAKDKKGAISVFSLLGGALRTVSGLIGAINPQRVQIDTPLATIGIRGTDHEVVYINRQISRTKKLKEGTYNKVYAGKTILRTSKGVLNLDLHQTGFVGVSKGQVEKPVRIKDLPAGIKSQLINKIPVQAKTLPKTDGQKSSSTAKTESVGGNKSNTTSQSGGSKVSPKTGNAAKVGVIPDVSKTPSPGGPVPVPYPDRGVSLPTVGKDGVKAIADPALTNIKGSILPSVGTGGSVKGVAPTTSGRSGPTVSIPTKEITPKVSIPTPTIAPKVSIPTSVTPSVSIPKAVTPSVSIPKAPAAKPAVSVPKAPAVVPKVAAPKTPAVVPKVSVPKATTAVPKVSAPTTTKALPKTTVPTKTLPKTLKP